MMEREIRLLSTVHHYTVLTPGGFTALGGCGPSSRLGTPSIPLHFSMSENNGSTR